jgi:type I restriction enzyme S subunit
MWKNSIFTISTISNISAEKYNECLISIPPKSEQTQIATYLDQKTSEVDNLISLKQQKISELKEYKKSLIYEYVTGKKEVIND